MGMNQSWFFPPIMLWNLSYFGTTVVSYNTLAMTQGKHKICHNSHPAPNWHPQNTNM